MPTGYFQIIKCGYQVPVQAIVFVLASVCILHDPEHLTLPVYMLDQHSFFCLLSIMPLLLLGELLFLARLEWQYGIYMKLAKTQKTKVCVQLCLRVQFYLLFFPDSEVVLFSFRATNQQNKPREQAHDDHRLNCVLFFYRSSIVADPAKGARWAARLRPQLLF